MKTRQVVAYKHYFDDFFVAQTQKTPFEEISRAVKLMNEYYEEQRQRRK